MITTKTFSRLAADHFDAAFIPSIPANSQNAARIIQLALCHRIPTVGDQADWANGGLLLSYGHDLLWGVRRAAEYTDKILRGAKPSELPVEQPPIELVINLQRPLGSECCATTGDRGCEAYTAIAWGVGLSHERSDIAGAEGLYSLEGNMCSTAMRGVVALPGSKATSRAKGSHRKLGDLVPGRDVPSTAVRIGKARSRSR